jgi:hypothetical protein
MELFVRENENPQNLEAQWFNLGISQYSYSAYYKLPLPCSIPLQCFLYMDFNLFLTYCDFMLGPINFHGFDMPIEQTGDSYCWFCYFPSEVVCARAHLPSTLLSQWVHRMFNITSVIIIIHLIFNLKWAMSTNPVYM